MYVCKYFEFVYWFLQVNTRIVAILNKVKKKKNLTEADIEHLETRKLNSPYSPVGKNSWFNVLKHIF